MGPNLSHCFEFGFVGDLTKKMWKVVLVSASLRGHRAWLARERPVMQVMEEGLVKRMWSKQFQSLSVWAMKQLQKLLQEDLCCVGVQEARKHKTIRDFDLLLCSARAECVGVFWCGGSSICGWCSAEREQGSHPWYISCALTWTCGLKRRGRQVVW